MKVSSDRGHPAFTDCFAMCKVFLAGAERSNVIVADEEGRYAMTWRPDEFGNPVLHGDKIQTEHFHGDVRIESPNWLRKEIETGVRVHHGGEIV